MKKRILTPKEIAKKRRGGRASAKIAKNRVFTEQSVPIKRSTGLYKRGI